MVRKQRGRQPLLLFCVWMCWRVYNSLSGIIESEDADCCLAEGLEHPPAFVSSPEDPDLQTL